MLDEEADKQDHNSKSTTIKQINILRRLANCYRYAASQCEDIDMKNRYIALADSHFNLAEERFLSLENCSI